MKNETAKTPGTYKISELAKAAGVKPSTLRYYQRRGLLPVPPSPQNGGSRRYGAKDMERLRIIRAAQLLGFSLKEIGDHLLPLHEKNDCDLTRTLISSRRAAVDAGIRKHQTILQHLDALSACCLGTCQDGCAIFRTLLGAFPGAINQPVE